MTRPDLTLEQAAFEAFGEAWKRLRTVEEAVKAGEGASFTHREAIREMQAAAAAVRAAVLAPLAVEPTIAKLQAEAFATLRETVTWYADKSNYTDGSPGEWSPQPLHSFDNPSEFEPDEGQRARTALASVQALGPLFDDTSQRPDDDSSGGSGLSYTDTATDVVLPPAQDGQQ